MVFYELVDDDSLRYISVKIDRTGYDPIGLGGPPIEVHNIKV